MSSSRTFINIANKYDRVIILIDMDCFFCQVEEKLKPALKGKPVAVVQYNAWRGGGIIAVNYAARAMGVTRHMRGDEARELCPDIELCKVPNIREKADLAKYREAGKEVAAVLQTFTPLLERASVDEAYLDITEQVNKKFESINDGCLQMQPSDLTNTYAVGYENFGDYIQEITSKIKTGGEYYDDYENVDGDDTDLIAMRKSSLKMLLGASIAGEIRANVKEKTGYDCSAGIAHNKILAKLACGLNKPNKQTILPLKQIPHFFKTLPVNKIKGLGGKFGEELCEIMKVKFLGELIKFTETELQRKFDEKNGSWLYLMARGIDLEAVTPRFYSKSIGCCKKFPGRNAISGLATLNHWLNELSTEIADRIEKDVEENNRVAKKMVLSYIQEINGEDVSSSRSVPLASYDIDTLTKSSLDVLRRNTDQFLRSGSEGALNNPIKFLGISVGKFESIESNQNTLQKMFANQKKKEVSKANSDVTVKDDTTNKKNEKSNAKNLFVNHFKRLSAERDSECVSNQIPAIPSGQNENSKVDEMSFFKRFLKNKPEIPIEHTDENNPKSDSISTIIEEEPKEELLFVELPELPIRPEKRKADSLLEQPMESESQMDYIKMYAELATPELLPEHFTTCTMCGEKVIDDESAIQSHNDRHYAEQISQQQREEFRSANRAKFALTPPQKKAKTSSATVSKVSKTTSAVGSSGSTNIVKFLKKQNRETIVSIPSCSTSIGNVEEVEKCTECGQTVKISKLTEHADYHLARKLQIEMNKSEIHTVIIKKPATPVDNKKLKASRLDKDANSKTNKSIAEFFNHPKSKSR